MKKRKASSPMMVKGRQSKKLIRSGPDEDGVKIGLQSVAKAEEFFVATTETYSAIQLKAESAFQLLKLGMRDFGFVRDTSFSYVEDFYELEMGFTQHQKVNLLMAELPHITCSARSQVTLHSRCVLQKKIDDAVKVMSGEVAPQVHGHVRFVPI